MPELFARVTKTLRNSCEGETCIWSQISINLWLGHGLSLYPSRTAKVATYIFFLFNKPLCKCVKNNILQQNGETQIHFWEVVGLSFGGFWTFHLQFYKACKWQKESTWWQCEILWLPCGFSLFFFFGQWIPQEFWSVNSFFPTQIIKSALEGLFRAGITLTHTRWKLW